MMICYGMEVRGMRTLAVSESNMKAPTLKVETVTLIGKGR